MTKSVAAQKQLTATLVGLQDARKSVIADIHNERTISKKIIFLMDLMEKSEEEIADALRKGTVSVKLQTSSSASSERPSNGRIMTPEKVKELRLRAANGETPVQLAEAYGISSALARNIINRKRHANVE